MIFFVANSEKCCKYTFLGGSAQIITILHRGGLSKFITILHGGGLPNLLQYYNGGGVSRDPKFVLRNIWTAPYRKCDIVQIVQKFWAPRDMYIIMSQFVIKSMTTGTQYQVETVSRHCGRRLDQMRSRICVSLSGVITGSCRLRHSSEKRISWSAHVP